MTVVTEEMVEAGARAAYAWTYSESAACRNWDTNDPIAAKKAMFRSEARAVLTAALSSQGKEVESG